MAHDDHSSGDGLRAIFSEAVMRKPRLLKNHEKEEECHEAWAELLHDLVCVAMLLKLGATLKYCGTGLPNFMAVFNIFLVVWINGYYMDSFINRIKSESLFQNILYMGVILGTFLMTMSINDSPEAYSEERRHCESSREYEQTLRWGFIISRVSVGLLAYIIQRSSLIPRGRKLTLLLAWVQAALVVVALGQEIRIQRSPLDKKYSMSHSSLFVIANIVDYTYMFVPSVLPYGWLLDGPADIIPAHVGHIKARWDLFVMITLGEGVIQLLNEPLSCAGKFLNHIRLTCSGCFLLYGLALSHFDALPHDIHDYVYTKSRLRASLCRIWYPLFYFSLFLVGVSFKLTVHSFKSRGSELDHSCAGYAGAHHDDGGKNQSIHSDDHSGGGHQEFVIRRLSGHPGPGWTDTNIMFFVGFSLTVAHLWNLVMRHVHAGIQPITNSSGAFLKFMLRLLLCCLHGCWSLYCHFQPGVDIPQLWPHACIMIPGLVFDMQICCEAKNHDDHNEAPAVLFLTNPCANEFDGVYCLHADAANHHPVWKMEGQDKEQDKWLFCNTEHEWVFAHGSYAVGEGLDFDPQDSDGFLKASAVHGEMPDCETIEWKRREGMEWKNDGDIKVSQAPLLGKIEDGKLTEHFKDLFAELKRRNMAEVWSDILEESDNLDQCQSHLDALKPRVSQRNQGPGILTRFPTRRQDMVSNVYNSDSQVELISLNAGRSATSD